MNAALRAPATVVAKVAKVPLRVVMGAPLIKDPATARRLLQNLEAFRSISKQPAAIRALAKAEATDPQERLKYCLNQYSAFRHSSSLSALNLFYSDTFRLSLYMFMRRILRVLIPFFLK